MTRRYEILLRAYPGWYRQQWGDELLGTLLARTDPHRRRPPVRETWSLLTSGVRVRLCSERDRDQRVVWNTGLRVAVVLLLAFHLADMTIQLVMAGPQGRSGIAMLVLAVLACLAVLRDHPWPAVLAVLGWEAMSMRAYERVSLPLVVAVLLLVPVALLRQSPPRPMPGIWWLAAPTMLATFWAPQLVLPPDRYFDLHGYQQVVFLVLVVLGGVGTLVDSRAGIAAVGLLLAEGLTESVSVFWAGDNPSHRVFSVFSVSWWGVTAGVLAVVLVAVTHLVTLRRAGT